MLAVTGVLCGISDSEAIERGIVLWNPVSPSCSHAYNLGYVLHRSNVDIKAVLWSVKLVPNNVYSQKYDRSRCYRQSNSEHRDF